MKNFICGAVLLLIACGCAHTSTLEWTKPAPGQRSAEGNPVVWNVYAVNRGMYLFNLIPIWSGYPSRPNRHDYLLGQHTLTRGQMRRMLELNLDKWGADRIEDVEISSSSSGAFTLWIIWRRTMQARGVAVKNVPYGKKTETELTK
ncbi:MAG: hypothetical protein E7051_03230 [Lentisphaerae bacterium]|nr:hypothetical protein [Lentisphaerota bacterium]MBQ4329290.1 hypothetical protein [Lentisphaeria bacterium]